MLLNTTAYEYDAQLHVTKTTLGNGRFSTTEWICCGVLNETDEDGITPETITEYTRDAAGRVLCTTRRIGAMETTESSEYDALGRVTKQTDILGHETTTAYSEDGLTTTVTTPAGATSIITRNTDDSTARVAGTGQRELVYVYDLNGVNEGFTTKLANGATIAYILVPSRNKLRTLPFSSVYDDELDHVRDINAGFKSKTLIDVIKANFPNRGKIRLHKGEENKTYIIDALK